MEERAYLFATWVAPVVYLTARAYAPTEHVVAQLNMVHRAALDINNWHLTMPILALPPAEGGLGQVGLGIYASWVHSQTFVQAVVRPASLAEQHARPFRGWADRVGLVLEPAFLPYLQLASIPLTKPTFLQGTVKAVKAYSVVRRGGGPPPPPPPHELWSLGVWHCVFFRNKVWLTYYCPALHRRGVLRWCDLISGSKIPPQLLGTVAPTWRAIYEESALRVVGMYEPSFAVPATPPVDNWSVQWTKRRTLLAMQQRTRHEARQSKEVWRVFGCLHLPKWDLDFIRRVLWRKLPVGATMERLGGKLCPQCGRVEDHAHTLKRCYFSAFMFDTVRKAFGLARGGVGLGWVKASPGRLPTVRAAFPAGPDRAAVPGCPVTRPTGLLTAPRPRGGARGREMPPCLCVCALVCLWRGGGGCGTPACSIVVRRWRTWCGEVCAWCSRPRQGGWRA